jgi:hypothetical protein
MRISRLLRCDRIASDYREFWYRRGTRGVAWVPSSVAIGRQLVQRAGGAGMMNAMSECATSGATQ